MKVTRVAAGIYDVVCNGVRYELERYPDGSWLTFGFCDREYAPREYLQDYATKREALVGLASI